jgi:ethanolamine ammonia-lyase large subunit
LYRLCTIAAVILGVVCLARVPAETAPSEAPNIIKDVKPGEDVFAYITRIKGKFIRGLYQQVIGASNAFKKGRDHRVGAADEMTRQKRAPPVHTRSRTSMNTRCLPTICRS